jgi:hypothetical protein
MTSDSSPDVDAPTSQMGDVLSQVRQIDPKSDQAAVRGYVREMAEAEAVLNSVDLSDAPLLVSFSASWLDGRAR